MEMDLKLLTAASQRPPKCGWDELPLYILLRTKFGDHLLGLLILEEATQFLDLVGGTDKVSAVITP
jgi:hypothetical protein